MTKSLKPVEFRGDALDELRAFPSGARREAGHQIDRLQRGWQPFDWKPMPSLGRGVEEIRIRDEAGQFRVVSGLSDSFPATCVCVPSRVTTRRPAWPWQAPRPSRATPVWRGLGQTPSGPGLCARLDGVIRRLFAISKLHSSFLASHAQRTPAQAARNESESPLQIRGCCLRIALLPEKDATH